MSMDCMVAASMDCKGLARSMVMLLCTVMVADMDLGLDMVRRMGLDMDMDRFEYHRGGR